MGITHAKCVRQIAIAAALCCIPAFGLSADFGEGANAASTEHPIKLDGSLDEPAWQNAPPITTFFEIYPSNVAETSFETELRFVYDDKNLYVGIRSFDPQTDLIRSHFVKRDQISEDQDYVEILLDSLGSRKTAALFRTNPTGTQTDGSYDEESGDKDLAVDLEFDVRTSTDTSGWVAEFRIPLRTLRYAMTSTSSWTFLVNRNIPRVQSRTISSAPVPRAATCRLCFAATLHGVRAPRVASRLSLTPHVVFAQEQSDQTFQSGVDGRFHLRSDSTLDFTIAPDFSQVEADDLQFSLNVPFAQSLTEKRPFFLEGTDLLETQLPLVYTRSFSNPDAGIRITTRNRSYEYTALALRNDEGGLLIEPGVLQSSAGLERFSSTALVGRSRFFVGNAVVGALVSARIGDEAHNVVTGADLSWGNATDRVFAQIATSQTRSPDSPMDNPAWQGQELNGTAGALRWLHTTDDWYSFLTYQVLSPGFRSWNGLITQVGVSALSATSGLYFYPRRRGVTRISPTISVRDVTSETGETLNRSLSPGISLEGSHDTSFSISWNPGAQLATQQGTREYDSWSASLLMSPAPWMPGLALSFTGGENLNFATGDAGAVRSFQLVAPLKLFDRLELTATAAYQSLRAGESAVNRQDLTERYMQLTGLWHFSSKLYVQAVAQSSESVVRTFDSALDAPDRSRGEFYSLLASYQVNWQTRFFFGVNRSSATFGNPPNTQQGSAAFAKLTYAFYP